MGLVCNYGIIFSNPLYPIAMSLSIILLSFYIFKKYTLAESAKTDIANANHEIFGVMSSIFCLFFVFILTYFTCEAIAPIVHTFKGSYVQGIYNTPIEIATVMVDNSINEYWNVYINYNIFIFVVDMFSTQKTGFQVGPWGFNIPAYPTLKFVSSIGDSLLKIIGFIPFAPFLAHPLILLLIDISMFNYVLPAGIFLRFIPNRKVRDAGSLLISMALGAYIIYPTFLIINIGIIDRNIMSKFSIESRTQECQDNFQSTAYGRFGLIMMAPANLIQRISGTNIPVSPCSGILFVEHISSYFFKLFYSSTLSILISIMFMKSFTKIISFEIVEYVGEHLKILT